MPPQRLSRAYAEEAVVASQPRTTSGDSGVLSGYGDASTLRAQLDVTAAAGTSPNLTAFVEDSLDGVNWNVIGTFAAKTAAGREVINVTTPFADRIRLRWVITGTTPSFTFSVVIASQVPEVA